MDVNNIIQNIVGNIKVDSPKTLELKIGQVIKAMVLEILGNNEVLLNINGKTIKASIEGQVKPGHALLLQVSPKTDSANLVLNIVNTSESQIHVPIAEVLENLKQPVTKNNLLFLEKAQDLGIPLTKQNLEDIQRIFPLLKNANPVEVATSAALLHHKNIPITANNVLSIQSSLFKNDFSTILTNLQETVANMPKEVARLSIPTQQILDKVLNIIQNIRQSVNMQNNTVLPDDVAQHIHVKESTQGRTETQHARSTAPITQPSIPTDTHINNTVLQSVDLKGQSHIPGKSTLISPTQVSPENIQNNRVSPTQQQSVLNPLMGEEHLYTTVSRSPMEPNRGAENTSSQRQWPQDILKAVGINNEKDIQTLLKSIHLDTPEMTKVAVESPISSTVTTVSESKDNLKSVLLQLQNMTDVPENIRVIVEETIKSIVGQQLILVNDRTSSPQIFTSLSFPMMSSDGESSNATIHIQSRKKSNGKLDKDNCRLLFNLDMKNLGSTLVDVAIVNKSIAVTVYNTSSKEDSFSIYEDMLKQNIESLGFDLQSLKYQTLRREPKEILQESIESTMRPYKGMDVKI